MRRLVVFFARVGDLVMLTPILRQLARDGEVELLARPWARPLLGDQPWLAGVHTLAHPSAGDRGLDGWLRGGERRRLGPVLGARGYDEIVVFQGETALIRGWIDGWRGPAVMRSITRAGSAHRHVVDANRDALVGGGFSVDGFDAQPRLVVPPAALAAARARLAPLGRRVLAIQAGSSLTHAWWRKRRNLKGLAPGQWAELLTRLFAAGRCDGAVLHGSAPEGREARAIRARLPAELRARVQDWTGAVPLGELRAVLAASHAVLSVDTGPAHIAAAVGTPLLVVFGPTDPAVFQPRGPGAVELMLGKAPCQFCHETPVFKTCKANVCLTTMNVEQLVDAYGRLTARAEEAEVRPIESANGAAPILSPGQRPGMSP